MASTHANGVLQSSTSAAVGTPVTSSTLDNSTGYGAVITAKATNGGTGPSTAITATLNISPDGTTWYFWASQTAGLTASAVYPMPFVVPPEAIKAQVVFAGNVGQAVTVEAQYQQLTGV